MDYLFRGGKRPHGNHPNQARLLIIRQAALDRDKRCRVCGNDNKDELQGHHINYRSYGAESVDDLTILCKGCHMYLHERIDFLGDDFFDKKPSEKELLSSNIYGLIPEDVYWFKIIKAQIKVSKSNTRYMYFDFEVMSNFQNNDQEFKGKRVVTRFWIENHVSGTKTSNLSGWQKLRELCMACHADYEEIKTPNDLIKLLNLQFIGKVAVRTGSDGKQYTDIIQFIER